MKEMKSQQSDYKVMLDMIKDAKEQYDMYKGLLKDGYRQDDISLSRAQFLFDAYTLEDIKEMDDDIAKEMLEKVRIPENPDEAETVTRETDDEWVKGLCKDYYESSKHKENSGDLAEDMLSIMENENEPSDDFETEYESHYGDMVRAILLQMKKDISSLKDSETDIKKLEDESSEVTTEYMNYMCSPEFEERKHEHIADLKSKLETIDDEIERKKMEKMISDVERSYDLSFLLDRLKENPKREAMNIVNTFFDDKRSSYILSRCKEKLPKIGFNVDVYRFFFNIEENYLPEKYHVYNNLFLFCVMRFISYANINSKTDCSFVRAIISSMSKLIYEKFSEGKREEFISLIEEILSYFEDYQEKFERDNFLHPNHPRRIEKDREHERDERKLMIDTLTLNGVDVDFDSMSTDDLKDFYKKTLDEIKEKKEKEKVKDLEEFIEKTKKEDSEEEAEKVKRDKDMDVKSLMESASQEETDDEETESPEE